MIKTLLTLGVVGLFVIAIQMAPVPTFAQQDTTPRDPEFCKEVVPSEILDEGYYCEEEQRFAELVVTITPPTCQSGEVLTYDDPINAYIDEQSTPSGTEGPAEYEVTAFAFEGARFVYEEGVYEGGYVKSLSGELSGPLSVEACTVVTPAVPQTTAPLLPETSAASPFVVVAAAVMGTIGLVAIAAGIRSVLGRSL